MSVHIYVLQLDDENSVGQDFKRQLDEFLDIYSLYLKTGIEGIKEEAVTRAFQIHLRDPQFTFVF